MGVQREPTEAEAVAEMMELVTITMTRMQWWVVVGALCESLASPNGTPAPDVARELMPEIVVGIEAKTGLDEEIKNCKPRKEKP